jgi:acetolactate synthase-1/2/3 large subunit
MASVAELTAQTLGSWGVEHLFGVPGGEVLDLMEAARAEGINFVLVGQESSAAFMAEAGVRLTGNPGAVLATLGPGATNLVTGVAHALLDRVPMAALTGSFGQDVEDSATHQVLDQGELFKAVAKGSWRLRPSTAHSVLGRAFRLALQDPPGPVHLSLSAEDARGEAAGKGTPQLIPPRPPQADPQALARAASLLQASRRPILVAGLGAMGQGIPRALSDLASHVGIPVVVTSKAKGIVDEAAPNFLGVVGLGMAADGVLREVMARADLVLMVGYDPVEVVPSWLDAHRGEGAVVTVAAVHDPAAGPADVALVGDIGDVLSRLAAKFHSGALRRWAEGELEEARKRVLATLATPCERGVPPQQVVLTLRRLAPVDAIATVDVGSHKILACQAWEARRPGTFLVSNGLSSMGFALPAANAAKLVKPSAPVVAMTGDGGLLMALHEMEVTERLDLPILVVLFNDGCLALIKEKQRRRGYQALGMDYCPIDWPKVAEGFGFESHRVESPGALEGRLREALRSTSPCLVDVAIDWEAYRPML